MCTLMGQSLAVFWNSCLLLQSFYFVFFKKKGLGVVFLNLSVGDYNGLPDLKNTKQLKFCIG